MTKPAVNPVGFHTMPSLTHITHNMYLLSKTIDAMYVKRRGVAAP